VNGLDACIEAMARHNVDVAIFGREANARLVAGTARLWLAGTRAFSPSCVVVAATRAAHVLANTDAVVPAGFATERLFGITWNPEILGARVGAIPGVRSARTVAVDGMNPGMFALLGRVIPDAQFVDAQPIVHELSRQPDRERVEGVAAASAIARAALATMAEACAPTATPATLRGVSAQAVATHGVTTPAFEAVAAPLGGSTWLPEPRPFRNEELVVLRVGVIADGWEASLARTYRVGAPAVEQPPPAGWSELVATCTPGTRVGSLRARGATVYGVGRGVEAWDDDQTLANDSACALELATDDCIWQDVVFVR
jgi:Xaa-Pro aminopeptidase